MVGLAREGHAPVTELMAGEMYVLSHPNQPEIEWCKLLMFKESRVESFKKALSASKMPELRHYFWPLAENSPMIVKEAGDIDRRTISIPTTTVAQYSVRLATKEELALFIGADRVYNNLKRVLKYGRPTKRVKKVKIPFRAHMRKGHQRGKQ